MDKSNEAPTKTSGNSLRSLLEQLELAVKFGSAQDLESAANKLLANAKYDQFTGYIKKATYGPREQIVESANPVVAFEKLSQYRGKDLAGASIHITCGHCGSSHKMVSSTGDWGAHHIDYVLDNFPEEL